MTATDADYAWLAGLWDGEGYIGLQRNYGNRKNTIWAPRAQIEMTHALTIDRVVALAEALDCSYRRTEMTERNARWRNTSRLVISSYWSVSQLGHALLPYAVTKREQWRLILEYIDGRAQRLGGYTEKRVVRTRGRYVDRLYTPQELDLIGHIRTMNRPLEGPDEPQRRRAAASVGRRMGRPGDASG